MICQRHRWQPSTDMYPTLIHDQQADTELAALSQEAITEEEV